MRRASLGLLLACVVAVVAWGQRVTTGEDLFKRQHEIGKHLKCQCNCSYTIADCNMLHCSYREQIKPEIRAGIEAGFSNEEVIERIVAKYGSELRMAPRREGFGAVGWAMPFVALLLGLVAAPFVVRRWKKQKVTAPERKTLSRGELERYEERIEKELAQFD